MPELLRKMLSPDPAGGGGGGSAPPTGGGDPAGGGAPAPPQGGAPAGGGASMPSTPPAVDPNQISAAARLEQAKAFGFSSVEEMREFVTKSRQKPAGAGEPDVKELQHRIEIADKNIADAIAKYQKSLKENAFHTAVSGLGVQLHDIEVLKNLALQKMAVMDDDKIVIKNETGDVVLNQKGERLAIGDYLQSIVDAKPYLVKNIIKPGMGIPPGSQQRDTANPVTLSSLKNSEDRLVSLKDFQEATKQK